MLRKTYSSKEASKRESAKFQPYWALHSRAIAGRFGCPSCNPLSVIAAIPPPNSDFPNMASNA